MIRLKTEPSTINQLGDKIGTYYLSDNANIYEIQRRNNFEFVVPFDLPLKKAGLLDTDTDPEDFVEEPEHVIKIACSAVDIPTYTQSVIPIRRGNTSIKFAGVPEFGSGTVTLNDYIGADVVGVMTAWQNLSYNIGTEKVGLVRDYKRDCKLLQYSPDYQLVRTWVLQGCWISGLNFGSMSSEANEKVSINATIQYDRYRIEYVSEVETQAQTNRRNGYGGPTIYAYNK